VTDVLVLLVSFTVQFIAPVSHGVLMATGSIVHETGRLLFAQSELHDDSGRLLATGTGTFTRTAILLVC
jgi:acyl-coenzyme A thioesterase PaaI-like protein